MRTFVDRQKEMAILEKEYEKNRSSLIVLYGRRRVGKTSLCTEFIKGKPAIYFLASEESESQNRNQFKELTADFLNNALLKSADIGNWDVIFQTIVESRFQKQKTIIIIDEFQYLGKANPAFPSIFQRIWTKLEGENIMVILCGSLISMMEAQTLNYGSPLYGRRTAQIKLKQIPFRYYSEFYPGRNYHDLIETYSVTGGVPKYVELFECGKDIYDEITQNILNTSSFLYDEPNFLLQKEVNEVGNYFSIIKTIAAGNQKLAKMASVLEVPQSKLTRYLKTLGDLDILVREVPVTEKTPEKSKKGIYKIQDNFLLFWFKFVFPNLGYLESDHTEVVIEKIHQNFIDNHVSYIYEDICREQIWEMSADGSLPFMVNKVGRWWDNKNNEIDVVALNDESQEILFGECKYWKGLVGANVLKALENKAKLVQWNNGSRKEHYVLFSVNGFTEELKKLAETRENVTLAY